MKQKLVFLFVLIILFLGSPKTEKILSDLEYSVMVWRLRFIFGTWKQFVFDKHNNEGNVNVIHYEFNLKGRSHE